MGLHNITQVKKGKGKARWDHVKNAEGEEQSGSWGGTELIGTEGLDGHVHWFFLRYYFFGMEYM